MNIKLKVENIEKSFRTRKSIRDLFTRTSKLVHAVDNVTFEIADKEIFGLVGESGCGKTTIGRLIVKLIEPTAGKIWLEGRDITTIKGKDLKRFRREVQMIFQDPYESLTPRISIHELLREPISIHKLAGNKSEEEELIDTALAEVGLSHEVLEKRPSELSGGQRQRISISRALLLKPKFLVADEPVSMLDISIKASILKLMLMLRDRLNLSELFITHDIAIARYICNRIGVMYLGKIVEIGPTEQIINNPIHPYTIALILAVPLSDPTVQRVEVPLRGEIASAITLPRGCRFHTRCLYAEETCRRIEPELRNLGKGHYVACHMCGAPHHC